MLGEIQSLKNQVCERFVAAIMDSLSLITLLPDPHFVFLFLQLHYAMTTNSAIDAERETWSRLVDSNVRSGIIACIWCMKAQVVKITAMAFHKWKAYKILEIRLNPPRGEVGTFDASSSNATAEAAAAAAAAQYFRHLMSQIPPTADLTKSQNRGAYFKGLAIRVYFSSYIWQYCVLLFLHMAILCTSLPTYDMAIQPIGCACISR